MVSDENRFSAEKPENAIAPERLREIQHQSFTYFQRECNPDNGLIADNTGEDSLGSIAATGFALSCYPIAVSQGWLDREDAARRTVQTLRFCWQGEQSRASTAIGYKGFFYHFLDMESGRRAGQTELSTIDTGLLVGGILIAREYFANAADPVEREINDLATRIYERVDWDWARNGQATLSQGWSPEHGFLENQWQGYDESLFLYLLALASPTHPIPAESYEASVAHYRWTEAYGYEYLYAGPLFTHQYPHVWIDFREIQDPFMREHHSTYFENSRRATCVQQQYAIHNPYGFEEYGPTFWGLTASDGPGPATRAINGVRREFFDYVARGAPHGPDDGTIAPWAAASSLPFAPEIVLPTLQHFDDIHLECVHDHSYGYAGTVNPTFAQPVPDERWWISDLHYGINQGPLVLMVENYQSAFVWDLMKQCTELRNGLLAAGFRGGWLDDEEGSS